MNSKELISKLQGIVGREYVLHFPEDLLVYEYDGSIDRRVPLAVALPANAAEARQVVAAAHAAGVAVVGRGSGTGLSGGAIPIGDCVQVSLARMNRIISIDTANRLAIVEPGVINYDLDQAARRAGLRYPPDPSSQKACSLGGNIAENAGGPHCLAYGVTSNYVLGMEVILEDGEMTWLGGSLRQHTGYDLRGAFVGSEGMFGIVTKAVVRLLPVPPAVRTYLAAFGAMDDACGAVSAVIGAGVVPAAMEIMDALTIRAVREARPTAPLVDADAALLIELEGEPSEVKDQGEQIEAILHERGASDVRRAQSESESERLWSARKNALGALGALAPNYYLVDGVVPRTRLAETLREVAVISERYDTPIANVFHAGDGNLHPCILFDERRPGEVEKVIEIGGKILEICVAMGGTLSGEHGIGIEKKSHMPLVYTDYDMAAMRRVADCFAPRRSLNPGKVFPDGESDARGLQRGAIAAVGPGAHV